MIERHLLKNDLQKKRWRRFKKNRLAFFSTFVLGFFIFLSFTAKFWVNNKPLYLTIDNKSFFPVLFDYHPEDLGIEDALDIDYKALELSEKDLLIWPFVKWGPNESNDQVESYPSRPTAENLMGTDNRGRDVLARILYGLKYSVIYAFSVWFLSFALATLLGGLMGYFGGRVDFWGQRIVEILGTVPQFFLLIIVISIFEPSVLLLVIISSAFGWIGISDYVRGEFLKNRSRDFVEAAKAMGSGHLRIIFGHIFPNSLTPLLTYSPFVIASNIVVLSSLDYLGFGLTPPTPSWGELLNQAKEYFTVAWWLAVYPSAALFGTLTLLALIGDGVRDAMDPHMS